MERTDEMVHERIRTSAMTNDDNFGHWIDWAGGERPIPDAKAGEYDLQFADGNPSSVVNKIAAAMWNWREGDVSIPIIAYRVRLPADDLLRQAIEALRAVIARADEAISCLPKGAQDSAKSGGGFVFPLDNDTAMTCRAVLAIAKERGL